MNQATQIRLVRRVLDLLARDATEMVERPARVDTRRYVDADRLDAEVALLRDTPLAVAHSSLVASPGDFLTRDVAGLPVLVVRGQDGVLRAFLNVCRHRGTRLCSDEGGARRRRFVCPYHGWSWAADGQLAHVPDAFGFPDLSPARRRLAAVSVAEGGGFVWVRGSAGPLDIADWLGPVADDLDALGVADHVVHARTVLHRPLNWKLVFDVFLEAYHLRVAHRGSIYPMFFDNLGLFDRLGPHLRNVFPKRSIRGLEGADPDSWRLREHGNVLYVLFPTTLLLVQPDHLSVLHVTPEGTDQARLDTATLVPERPASDKARDYWERNRAILYGAIEEDLALGASIQQSVRAGANVTVVFGRFEQSLAWFHAALDARLQAEAAPQTRPVTRS